MRAWGVLEWRSCAGDIYWIRGLDWLQNGIFEDALWLVLVEYMYVHT